MSTFEVMRQVIKNAYIVLQEGSYDKMCVPLFSRIKCRKDSNYTVVSTAKGLSFVPHSKAQTMPFTNTEHHSKKQSAQKISIMGTSSRPADNPTVQVTTETPAQLPAEEGLQGWLCVLGANICIFCSLGFLNSYVLLSCATICRPFKMQMLIYTPQQNRRLSDDIPGNISSRLYGIQHFVDICSPAGPDVRRRAALWTHCRHLRSSTRPLPLHLPLRLRSVYDEPGHRILSDSP